MLYALGAFVRLINVRDLIVRLYVTDKIFNCTILRKNDGLIHVLLHAEKVPRCSIERYLIDYSLDSVHRDKMISEHRASNRCTTGATKQALLY